MIKLIKQSWLACAVAASSIVTGLTAQAAATYNGDLIIGFSAGSGKDLEYDLGQVVTLKDGETFPALTALLGSYTLSTLQWGIIGNTLNGVGGAADNQVFSTTSGSTILPGSVNQTVYNGMFNATKSVYGLFPAAGAGQHTSPSIGLANSWYAQTVSPTLTTQYKNVYRDPNVSGTTSAALWAVDTQGGATKLLGTFSLAANGVLTFTQGSITNPPPRPAPPTVSIARSGSTTTISFGTTNGATYALHYTNGAGLSSSVGTWPALLTTVTGDGSTKSFMDTSTDADRVYRVSAR